MTAAAFPSSPIEGAFEPASHAIDGLWSRFVANGKSTAATRRLVFASARPGEGTTTVVACTGIGLARNTEASVLLVEANLRHPSLAAYLGLVRTPGVAEAIRGECPLAETIQATNDEALHVLVAGGGEHVPGASVAAVLEGPAFREVLSRYRYVLVDAPPVLEAPESRLLLRGADGVVLVLRAGRSNRSDAAAAKRLFVETGAPILGVVVNRYRDELPRWLSRRLV
jgi:receptor protein-tyrosine kinase